MRDDTPAHGVIRRATACDARGNLYECWEAYRPDGVLIACSPDKETLKAVLGVLNADIAFVEVDLVKPGQRSGGTSKGAVRQQVRIGRRGRQ
jgi:hypothetical protein